MLETCSQDKPVDLYFNDAYGLNELIRSFSIKKEQFLKSVGENEKTYAQCEVLDITRPYYVHGIQVSLYFETNISTMELSRKFIS